MEENGRSNTTKQDYCPFIMFDDDEYNNFVEKQIC